MKKRNRKTGRQTRPHALSEKQLKKKKLQNRLLIVEVAAVLAVILCLFVWGTGLYTRLFPAITINGQNYSLAEFNYYYTAYIDSYSQDYSDFIDYMFDSSQPLKDQVYDGDVSWFDFFVDEASDSMTQVLTVAAAAEEAGFELPESEEEAVNEQLSALDQYAENMNLSTDRYLTTLYGSGMTRELYEKHLRLSRLAGAYSDSIRESIELTDEEVEAYYQDNIQNYTSVDYERFYARAAGLNETATEEQRAAAKQIAEEIYQRVQNGESLEEASADYSEDGVYYEMTGTYYDPLYSYGDWLFSSERVDGDSTVIDDGNGFYVMVFHNRYEDTYNSAKIIDMSFPVDATETDSDQALEDSCTEAEDALAEWQSGEATQESFETMAADHAEELQEQNSDGEEIQYIYEDATEEDLDDSISSWCFDEARQSGDCEVVYTASGFHLIYYVGEGDPAWQVKARADLTEERYQAWYTELTESVQCVRHDWVLQRAGGE